MKGDVWSCAMHNIHGRHPRGAYYDEALSSDQPMRRQPGGHYMHLRLSSGSARKLAHTWDATELTRAPVARAVKPKLSKHHSLRTTTGREYSRNRAMMKRLCPCVHLNPGVASGHREAFIFHLDIEFAWIRRLPVNYAPL